MAKKMIKIIRKVDIEQQYREILELELDYELASLYEAMESGDKEAKKRIKKRLREIHKEMDSLQAYV